MNGSLNFVLGISNNVFGVDMHPVKVYIFGCIAAAFAAAVILAVGLSYKQSQPIKGLMTVLEKIGIDDPSKKDIFEYAQHTIAELNRSRNHLEQSLQRQRSYVAYGFFERLLKDGILNQEELEEAESF